MYAMRIYNELNLNRYGKELGDMAIVFKNGNQLVNEQLAIGDKFATVIYRQYGGGPSACSIYTVDRVMKRDIVCKMSNGEEYRISKNQSHANCYLPDDPAFLTIRMEIRRKIRVINIVSRLRLAKGEEIAGDEEFMVAAEAFFTRLDAVSN